MVLFFNSVKRIILLSLLSLISITCGKDQQHPVPSVPVDFRINTEFQYIELNSIGGHVNVFGGFGGIVIYRMSIDEFTAFDRACPFDPHDMNARIVVEDSPLAKCNVCESTYLLLDGSPVTGPTKHPLRQYSTVFSDPYLYVSSY